MRRKNLTRPRTSEEDYGSKTLGTRRRKRRRRRKEEHVSGDKRLPAEEEGKVDGNGHRHTHKKEI